MSEGLIWGAVVAILIVIFSGVGAMVLANVIKAGRECNVNADCRETAYCGSDYKCHDFPTIQQTIVNKNYTTPAVILALAIVAAAFVMKWNNNHA